VVELTREELKQLEEKGHVMRTFNQATSSWPDVHIWMVIEADSLTAVGLYHALDIQKDYVPNIILSTPVLQVTPTEIHTQYELRMPWPLPNSRYINGTKIHSSASGIYKISWYTVQNDDVSSLEGWAIFTPWHGHNSLLYYRNKVAPKGILAGVLKKIAPKNMLETLQAVANYISKTAKSSPATVQKYENYIIRALKGEYVYQAPIKTQK
jgi:hypothetical protein